jgi:hypothetical protein
MQFCGVCLKDIGSNKALYRCGDMDTCSPECNTKRLESIYIIDPNLSSPTRWITNRTFRYDSRDSPKNTTRVEICEEEACFPESYHPEVIHQETRIKLHSTEEEKLGAWCRVFRLKRFTCVMIVPITIILCKTLLSIII